VTHDERSYYASHGKISDPGERAELLRVMPADPERLVTAVSRLILHRLFVAALGVTPHPESGADVETRTIGRMLDRLLARDAAPLDVPRPPERRFIGICPDYTLLACAVLRHHGIPARARVGFANYFTPHFNEDHWVCEYHSGDRWRLLDVELSEPVRVHFKIPFAVSDVPRDRFLTAGDAWLGVRRGALDPQTCGLSSDGLHGAWFVARNVVRDFAALNKREMLAWDAWGIMRGWGRDQRIPDAVLVRLDVVAALTSPSPLDWKTVRETYEHDDGLRVPTVVTSHGRPVAVDV